MASFDPSSLDATYRDQLDELLSTLKRRNEQIEHAVVASPFDTATSTLDYNEPDDVKAAVKQLRTAVSSSLKSELNALSQLSSAAICQVFLGCQAMQVNTIRLDVPQLEGLDVQEAMESYTSKVVGEGAAPARLPSIGASEHGLDPRVAKELLELRDQRSKLEKKIEDLQKELRQARVDVKKAEDVVNVTKTEAGAHTTAHEEDVKRISTLENEMNEWKTKCKDAEKELNAKVTDTTQFKNLQQMLQSKNEQLKALRTQLGGGDGGESDDDDVVEIEADDE